MSKTAQYLNEDSVGNNAAFNEEEQNKQDIIAIMSQAKGRRFIAHTLQKLGLYRTSFTGDNSTFFHEGMRNAALMLLGDILEHAPKQYAIMLEENQPL